MENRKDMKFVNLGKNINDEMEIILQTALQNIASLYGEKLDFSDTAMQAVYDLKLQAIDSLYQLGLVLEIQD